MPGKPGYKKTPEQRLNDSKARQRVARENLRPIPDEKRCTKCGEVKPQEEFSRRNRYVKAIKGKRQYLNPTCKACERERDRRRDPDKLRLWNRKSVRRIMADPVRAKRRREQQREWAAAKRRENGARAVGSWEREGPRSDMLPVGPIQEFLVEYFDRQNSPDIGAFADRTGIRPERIRRIMIGIENGRPLNNVSTIIVDKILMAADSQERFHDLYPVD